MRIKSWKCDLTVTAFVIFAAVLFVGTVSATAQNQTYTELNQQLQPLRDQFNADVGKVRVLMIGDPTCPPCRRGASVIQENVVSKFANDKLAVYVVWVPLLNLQDPATLQRHAHSYSNLLAPGRRVTHYTDPQAYSGKNMVRSSAYLTVLPLGMSISRSTPARVGAILPRYPAIGNINWAACLPTGSLTGHASLRKFASSWRRLANDPRLRRTKLIEKTERKK